MYTFAEELEQRIKKLKEIVSVKESALENAPDGTIHVFPSKSKTQFYLHANGKRRYIKESEANLVQILFQKDYDQRVLMSAKSELKCLEKAYHNYYENTCESVYEKMSEERKKRICPIWLPDEEYIRQWEQADYPKKEFADDAPEYYTNKGETEILIANALQKHNIPYRYEAPLKLEHYGVIHPDFTVLNVRLRKELYWEHMGLWDDETYRGHALERITAYEKNNIFPGIELILTHETQMNPIHSKILERMIAVYCK